jgi:hypothetical protein
VRQLCATLSPAGELKDQVADLDQLGSLLLRADMALEALAREHGHDPQPILPG